MRELSQPPHVGVTTATRPCPRRSTRSRRTPSRPRPRVQPRPLRPLSHRGPLPSRAHRGPLPSRVADRRFDSLRRASLQGGQFGPVAVRATKHARAILRATDRVVLPLADRTLKPLGGARLLLVKPAGDGLSAKVADCAPGRHRMTIRAGTPNPNERRIQLAGPGGRSGATRTNDGDGGAGNDRETVGVH